MRRVVFSVVLSLFCLTSVPQSFSRFIADIESLPEQSRQAKADSFMRTAGSFPLIEPDSGCHFIYKGPANSVTVAGDFTGWKPDNVSMMNIQGTDLWYCTKYFEQDARLDYKFVVNLENWILDPNNPNICKSGYGPNSELRMPRYIVSPETIHDLMVPPGWIIDTLISSTILGNSRTVKIYLPAAYRTDGKEYPVVLFHDGLEYITLANACIILDNMIAKKQIRPVIAVFVPPVDREPEYVGDRKDLYAGFICGELMPAIDAKYHTSRDPHDRANIGISNGGNISLYIGVTHPECFGKIAAYSTSVVQEIPGKLAKTENMDLEIYLDMGTYDIGGLIPMVDNLARMLDRLGYPYTYNKWHEGHSWGSWKGHLGVALKKFYSN